MEGGFHALRLLLNRPEGMTCSFVTQPRVCKDKLKTLSTTNSHELECPNENKPDIEEGLDCIIHNWCFFLGLLEFSS